MNGLPYYKAFPRDFIDGTAGMRLELKGAYRVVLDLIYMHGGRLPDDARYIAGQLGCSVRMWNTIRAELIGLSKLVADEGALSNFRADKELESLRKFSANQAEKASKPRKINTLQQPRHSHTDTDTDKKEKNPPTPRKRVEDEPAFSQFWAAYPRQVSKGSARKAFAAACRKAPAETIIAAARRVEDRGQYTPHPATWLNGERWSDQETRHEPDRAQQPRRPGGGQSLLDAAARASARFRTADDDPGGEGGTGGGGPAMDFGPRGGPTLTLLAFG